MAVILEGGCRVSEMFEDEPVVNGTLRIWNRIGRATGAQAISLRVMEFAPGTSPNIRNEDCDQILYLVRGDREPETAPGLVDLMINARSHKLDYDTGGSLNNLVFKYPGWRAREGFSQPALGIPGEADDR